LQAARALQATVGQRLARISAMVIAARQALSLNTAQARSRIAAVGVTAREAVADARAVTADRPGRTGADPVAPGLTGPVIGARLAWIVVVTVLFMYAAEGGGYIVSIGYGRWLTALAVGGIALVTVLQLYHSWAAREGRRPKAWRLTLALQAVVIYLFALPFVWAYPGFMGPFLAGSVLLLVRGRWRWAGYAVVAVSYSVLYTALPLRADPFPAVHRIPDLIHNVATVAEIGLMVYGLSRMAGLARELKGLRGELARMAAVRERLRVARDVHDLLGLGLSAIALKADLVGALIGRDDARAAAETDEMSRICAAARADVRAVTMEGARLSLAGELAAAEHILASAGIEVRAEIPALPLPAAADDVLAPVLREAVTNILRHAAATVCAIEVTVCDRALRLHVANDGAAEPSAVSGKGWGLANMSARVQAEGGQLVWNRDGGRFDLSVRIPLPGKGLARPRPAGSRAPAPIARTEAPVASS
jgi:two-component system, NarL family, sensor histidine kinase DesK